LSLYFSVLAVPFVVTPPVLSSWKPASGGPVFRLRIVRMTSGLPHILIVEDEEHLARGIQFNLEAEGYEVTVVGNGTAAVEKVEGDPESVDLVILDLMLPGMSGYAVCERLREMGAEMPVLMLSARTLTEDRTRGFDAGADQYLTKPFELDELLARVRGLLVRQGRRQSLRVRSSIGLPRTLQIGEARVDFDTFEVQREGRNQLMTPLELRLLQYLIQSEGRVVSRQELLENVWEQPGYLQTRAPDQFIRRLRKLIETDSAQPRHLLTVRDAGYRFLVRPEESQDDTR
jgi:two-component system OmpR family response regulator